MISRSTLCLCSYITIKCIPSQTAQSSPKNQNIKPPETLSKLFPCDTGFQSVLLPKPKLNVIFTHNMPEIQNHYTFRPEDILPTLSIQSNIIKKVVLLIKKHALKLTVL